jgi:hypothetical protein
MVVVFSPGQGLSDESAGLRGGRFAVPPSDCRLPCRANGVDDVLIPGASAEISLEPGADAFFARLRFAAKQLQRAHDHARGAETALQRVMLTKGRQQAVLASPAC